MPARKSKGFKFGVAGVLEDKNIAEGDAVDAWRVAASHSVPVSLKVGRALSPRTLVLRPGGQCHLRSAFAARWAQQPVRKTQTRPDNHQPPRSACWQDEFSGWLVSRRPMRLLMGHPTYLAHAKKSASPPQNRLSFHCCPLGNQAHLQPHR